MTDAPEPVAALLRRYRAELGLTRVQLAQRWGMPDHRPLDRWESGKPLHEGTEALIRRVIALGG